MLPFRLKHVGKYETICIKIWDFVQVACLAILNRPLITSELLFINQESRVSV